MRSRMRAFGVVALGAAALALGLVRAGTNGTAAAPVPPPALERFRALTGDWVSAEDGDMVKKGDLVARYHVSGAGSAVVEELFPGDEHAMTTVYTTEGNDLVLTHYCMAGNQPRMRAKSTGGREIAFAFDGGTNIDPKKSRFMHDAAIDFVGPDEIKTRWVEYDQGKVAMTIDMHLVRKTS